MIAQHGDQLKVIITQTAPWGGELQKEIAAADPNSEKAFSELGGKLMTLVDRCKATIDNLAWMKNWEEMVMYGHLEEYIEKFKNVKGINEIALQFGLSVKVSERRRRIYRLWREYQQFAYTCVPLSVWDKWIGRMEMHLKHPSQQAFAAKWSNGPVKSWSFSEILLQVYKASSSSEEEDDEVLDEHPGADDQGKGKDRDKDDGDGNDPGSPGISDDFTAMNIGA